VGALKQRSPAGARWAVTQFHQIEKMNHRESSIVGGNPIPVKLTANLCRRKQKRLDGRRTQNQSSFHKEKPGL